MGEVSEGEEIRKGSERGCGGHRRSLSTSWSKMGTLTGLSKEGQNLTHASRGSPGSTVLCI